ncbi:MAG: SGNH/GDSL hydrolase family protein, partial [Candidatus Dadabacteria bacterium]
MFKNRVIKRIVDKVHKRIGDPPTPHPDLNYMVMDPDFIFRGCPNDLEQGHDQLGYRNENIPNKIEHLFVGDSQVYGTSVNANQTFPYLLKHAMKREVYNGSCGGYGPFQYALVVDELLPLNPKHVTLFIYNGNDLSDATRAAIMSESSLADLVGDGLESLPAPDLSCSAAKKKFIEEFKRQNGDQPRSEILLAAAKADIPDCNPA